jgi:DNA-binding transcriptional MerR regulator
LAVVGGYRISELARRSGAPASTLRFYEQAGLLPAARTRSGYRVYDDEAVRRLEFIGSAKRLGLPLEEIRELLGAWEQGVCAEVRARLRPLVAARLAEAEQRIAEFVGVRGELGRGARGFGRAGPGEGVRAGLRVRARRSAGPGGGGAGSSRDRRSRRVGSGAMTRRAGSYRWWTGMGVAAALACGLCCAAPVIAVLGGFGALAAMGALFKVFELVSLVLAVLALGGAAVLWVRRRRLRTCQVPDRVADLGIPAPTGQSRR